MRAGVHPRTHDLVPHHGGARNPAHAEKVAGDFKVAAAKIANAPTGQHNLVLTMPEKNDVQIDWVSFE